jgi:Tol biopolymer transport system component
VTEATGPLRRARGVFGPLDPGMLTPEVKRLLALCGIATSLLVAAAAGTQAARPPALLTYAVATTGGLCLARPDGSHRVRLTRGMDRAPSWSPNGRSVVFSRQVGTATRILVANARGRVVRALTQTAAFADPAWSADGRRIAYVSREARSRIVVVDTAGQTVGAVLAAPPAFISRPAWAPNGRRIAFAEDPQMDGMAGSSRIVVANADGSGRRVLVDQASDPAWSPNGSQIAYVAYPSRLSETGSIVVANADGSGVRHITAAAGPESRPAWAPGGRRIAFTRLVGGKSTVVVARADGSGERVAVGPRGAGAVDPAWRPPVLLPRARRRAC